MRILYFHQHFCTPKGTGGIRSYSMARKLISQGHLVTIVCGSSKNARLDLEQSFERGCRRGIIDGIEIIEFDLPYSNMDGFIKRTITFLRFALRSIGVALSEDYDLVFATSTPLTAGIPGMFARWLRRKPFVFEVRDLWPELPREMGVITNPVMLWALGVLEWLSYKSAHRLVGLSPGIVEGIALRGVPRERIALIPNGCDLDIFTDKSEPWRPDSVADGDLMAVFAGTQGIANGLDALLDVAAELKSRGRGDIKLVLIGDGKLTPHLKSRKEAEQLENVLFLERVEKRRLAGLMASSDIGLQILANVPAFYFGTSPNKFFDYIASALPVLNNYPGWLAGLIEEHQCGYAVPPDDPKIFADALEHGAEDKERLREMGGNALELARNRFDRDQLADKWIAWVLEGRDV